MHATKQHREAHEVARAKERAAKERSRRPEKEKSRKSERKSRGLMKSFAFWDDDDKAGGHASHSGGIMGRLSRASRRSPPKEKQSRSRSPQRNHRDDRRKPQEEQWRDDDPMAA